jgi:hypothetical protein
VPNSQHVAEPQDLFKEYNFSESILQLKRKNEQIDSRSKIKFGFDVRFEKAEMIREDHGQHRTDLVATAELIKHANHSAHKESF